MKKNIKIILIIMVMLVGIILLDTLQAKVFDNKPIIKIVENYNGGNIYQKHKGILVDTYIYTDGSQKSFFKWTTRAYGEKNEETDKNSSEDYDKKLMQCLESELGGYLVTEKDNLIEIPLSEIKNNDIEKITYYKGVYASNHPENKYVIVYPKNGTYDSYVMKDFDKYFYENYSIYQTSESSSSPTIYIHNANNDVDFENVLNKCKTNNISNEGKSISDKTIAKIKNAKKIIIKSGQNVLGTINEENKLEKILNGISNSKQYGDAFLCDSHSFDFEMYDKNNKLIDTIYVWRDGKRLIPASISGEGCSYYFISNGVDLRKIIEDETDYIFYNILDLRDNDNQKQQLIYQDDKNIYYLKSENTNEILIKFMLNNQVMTLKYALENKYISAEKVSNEYPDVLIKNSK